MNLGSFWMDLICRIFLIPLFVTYLFFVSGNMSWRSILIYTVKNTARPTGMGRGWQNLYLWPPEAELGEKGDKTNSPGVHWKQDKGNVQQGKCSPWLLIEWLPKVPGSLLCCGDRNKWDNSELAPRSWLPRTVFEVWFPHFVHQNDLVFI